MQEANSSCSYQESPTQGSAALDSNEVMLAWMRRECFVCQVLEVEVTKVREVEGRREEIVRLEGRVAELRVT